MLLITIISKWLVPEMPEYVRRSADALGCGKNAGDDDSVCALYE